MVNLADLQNSPLFQRAQARQTARDSTDNQVAALRTNPLPFLGNHILHVVVGGPGQFETVIDTQVPVRYNTNDGALYVGAVALPSPATTSLRALVTPTRTNAVGQWPQRLQNTRRYQSGEGGSQFWLTEEQTGCTVLVIEWSDNRYSMVHLLPYLDQDYSYVAQGLFAASAFLRKTIKNRSLASDVATIAHGMTTPGATPQRYILAQSMFNAEVQDPVQGTQNRMQVIGIAGGGSWTFYRQIFNGQNILSAVACPWRHWNSDWIFHDV
jgi:hypothetical protein